MTLRNVINGASKLRRPPPLYRHSAAVCSSVRALTLTAPFILLRDSHILLSFRNGNIFFFIQTSFFLCTAPCFRHSHLTLLSHPPLLTVPVKLYFCHDLSSYRYFVSAGLVPTYSEIHFCNLRTSQVAFQTTQASIALHARASFSFKQRYRTAPLALHHTAPVPSSSRRQQTRCKRGGAPRLPSSVAFVPRSILLLSCCRGVHSAIPFLFVSFSQRSASCTPQRSTYESRRHRRRET